MKGYNRGLHLFSLFTGCCTFLLIVAGGLVTSTQSGLSVPDWPTTYGHFMFAYPLDQMVGGIFYEHSHRMIASFVGFLTIILAVWMWRKEDRRWVRNLSFAALAAVILQGVLGGLTVLFMLPTAISVSHATLAQTFFAIVVSLALFTSKWWRTDAPLPRGNENNLPLTRLAIITTLAVYVQLIIGALMRHTHSGLVVPDFPLAYGQLFPSLSPEAMDRYNQQLIQTDIRLAADGVVTQSQIVIHMLHRAWAFVTAILVGWTAIRLLKLSAHSKRYSRLGYALLGLVILQITFGALTVVSQKAVDITTAHVATGALLLVTCVLSSLHAVRVFGFRAHRRMAVSFATREVPA